MAYGDPTGVNKILVEKYGYEWVNGKAWKPGTAPEPEIIPEEEPVAAIPPETSQPAETPIEELSPSEPISLEEKIEQLQASLNELQKKYEEALEKLEQANARIAELEGQQGEAPVGDQSSSDLDLTPEATPSPEPEPSTPEAPAVEVPEPASTPSYPEPTGVNKILVEKYGYEWVNGKAWKPGTAPGIEDDAEPSPQIVLGQTDENSSDSPDTDETYLAFSAHDERTAPASVYEGNLRPERIVDWQLHSAPMFDVDGDGDNDLLVPGIAGYRTGIDTRLPMIFLENVDGKLIHNDDPNIIMPLLNGGRSADLVYIHELNGEALVVSTQYTGPSERASDFTKFYNSAELIPYVGYLNIFATLPNGDITDEVMNGQESDYASAINIKNSINTHSSAVGDLNGDGLDDIIFAAHVEPYALLQQRDTIAFEMHKTDFLTEQISGALTIDMGDLNGDGYDDLVYGDTGETSLIFFNDGTGNFSADASAALEPSVYGAENQNHMQSFIFDSDNDGDNDLLVYHVPQEPFYAGNYLALYINNGDGDFVLDTSLAEAQYDDEINTSFLRWVENIFILDINSDGRSDIAFHHHNLPETIVAYVQDQNNEFARAEFNFDAPKTYKSFYLNVLTIAHIDNDDNAEIIYKLDFLTSDYSHEIYVSDIITV